MSASVVRCEECGHFAALHGEHGCTVPLGRPLPPGRSHRARRKCRCVLPRWRVYLLARERRMEIA